MAIFQICASGTSAEFKSDRTRLQKSEVLTNRNVFPTNEDVTKNFSVVTHAYIIFLPIAIEFQINDIKMRGKKRNQQSEENGEIDGKNTDFFLFFRNLLNYLTFQTDSGTSGWITALFFSVLFVISLFLFDYLFYSFFERGEGEKGCTIVSLRPDFVKRTKNEFFHLAQQLLKL